MLTLQEIQKNMGELNDWALEENAIVKIFLLDNFNQSMVFVNKVAELAFANDHHPDIVITFNQVKLTLTTHSEKGLTDKDFILAKAIDAIHM